MKKSLKIKKIRQMPDYTVNSYEQKGGALGAVLQLVLLFLAVVAAVECVATSLAMTVSLLEIVAWCLLFTLLAAAAVWNKITTGIFTGVAVAGTLICLGPLQKVAEQINEAFRFCYDLGFVIMKMRGWNYTSRMLTDEEHIAELLDDEVLVLSYFRTIVILLALVFAIWFVAWSWKRPRVWPVLLIAIGAMVPGFTIGLVPSSAAFSLLLATAIGLYMQTLCGKKIHPQRLRDWFKSLFSKQSAAKRFAYSIKSGLYGICTAGVSLVVMLIVAAATLQSPLIELDQVRQYLDDGSRYVYNQLFYSRLETPDNAVGSMISGETLEVLKIPNIHKVPVFRMKSHKNQPVYLRAWVSDTYTKEGWAVLNESDSVDFQNTVVDGTNPYGFAWQITDTFESERLDLDGQETFGFVTDELELKARFRKSLVAHLPSYGALKLTDALAATDITAGEQAAFRDKRPSGNTYTAQAFVPIVTEKGYVTALHGLSKKYSVLLTLDTSDIESQKFQTLLKQERSYYKYVQKHFMSSTGMPSALKIKAEELAKGHTSNLTKALAIEKYFRNNKEFKYTLKPQKVVNASINEQIEYSLGTRKEGYCTYYATAMTLMVRSLGIPARYVTGYLAPKTDAEPASDGTYTRTVMDQDSHAWVEVYFAGIGWMPFDPTPCETETDEEYIARYYALEVEKNGGADAAENGGGGGADDIIQRKNFAEEDEDTELMPEMQIKYGIFGGIGLVAALLIVLAVLALTALIVLLLWLRKAGKHAEQTYLAARDGCTDPRQNIHEMYRLILKWLSLKKIEQATGESAYDFAVRVDQTLQTERSMTDIVTIVQRAEFSENEMPDTAVDIVRPYFDEMYQRMCHHSGGLSRIQKMKI